MQKNESNGEAALNLIPLSPFLGPFKLFIFFFPFLTNINQKFKSIIWLLPLYIVQIQKSNITAPLELKEQLKINKLASYYTPWATEPTWIGVPIVLGEKSFNRITQNKKANYLKLKVEHPRISAEAQRK